MNKLSVMKQALSGRVKVKNTPTTADEVQPAAGYKAADGTMGKFVKNPQGTKKPTGAVYFKRSNRG